MWSCFFFFFGGLGHERYVTHWEGRGAGLVVDCPGAMPFVRGIVGGVVYRDAAGRRRIELCGDAVVLKRSTGAAARFRHKVA